MGKRKSRWRLNRRAWGSVSWTSQKMVDKEKNISHFNENFKNDIYSVHEELQVKEQSQETTFDFDSAQRKADASLEEFNGK